MHSFPLKHWFFPTIETLLGARHQAKQASQKNRNMVCTLLSRILQSIPITICDRQNVCVLATVIGLNPNAQCDDI